MNSLIEMDKQTENLSMAQAQKEGIKNREQFLEIFPSMEDWLIAHEQMHGAFIGITSISFTDERCVFLYKFEKSYFVDFYNPANPEKEREKNVALSYEAANAFSTLFQLFKSEEDTRRFWRAIGVDETEIEDYLAKK